MSYMGTKILVTGADGFIGSHLTEGLVSAGADVTALAQYNSFDSHGWLDDLPDQIRKNVNLVRGDVRDAAFISRLVPRHEIIFHLAALIAIPHSYAAAQSYVDTNVLGTLNVLEAARQSAPSGLFILRQAKFTAPLLRCRSTNLIRCRDNRPTRLPK